MSRTFASITIPELKAKIDAVCGDKGVQALKHKLGKDIKVDFDLENTDCGPHSLSGYHTENGFTWWGMSAGGDWEHPVFFIVYWDGKRLRGYVPTDGNPWNSITKQAYGNDYEKDLKDARQRWPETYTNVEELESSDFDFDEQAIKADFMSRITSPAPKKVKKSIQERIEAVKFYGTNNESYELFQATCNLCYKMNALGDPSQAEILCQWVEDMALQSYEDVEDDDDLNDVVSGYWGHQ